MPLRRLERKNMQLKKIALVFLVVIMMFSLAVVCATAEEADSELGISVKIDSEDAISKDPLAVKPGDTVEFTIDVSSNPGKLLYLQVDVKFDPAKLELIGYKYGNVFDDEHSRQNVITIPQCNATGKIQSYTFADASFESDDTGVYITYSFKAIADGDITDLLVESVVYGLNIEDGIDDVITDVTVPVIKSHNYSAPADEAGTCVSSANKVYTCTHEGCDEVLKVPTGELGGHKCETLNEANAPTCAATGNVAYYVCANEGCGKYIAEDKTTVLDSVELAIDPNAHKCEADKLTQAVAPKCEEDGNVAYYVCGNEGCGKFIAEDKVTVLDDVVIPADGHDYGNLVAKVSATTEKEGAIAHYLCSVCGKYFNESKVEVTSLVIPKLPKMISVPEDSVWVKGSETSLSFVSNAKFEDFVSVKLNGALLSESDYKLEKTEDGTKVTLEPATLEKLSAGDYTITITSANGSCDAEFTVENNSSALAVVIVIIAVVVIVAGAAAAIVVLKKKNII